MGLSNFGYRGIRSEFWRRLNLADAGSWATQIAAKHMSDQEIETYRWLGKPPQMREWIGGRQERPLRDDVYTIKNNLYENTLALPVDYIRRDKTTQLQEYIADFAARSSQHWETLLTQLILDGEAVKTTYDGQFFFDTDHVSGASGTQTNDLGATEVPSSNVTTTTAPTPTELANIFLEMAAHFYKLKDDAGEPINQNAAAFTIMVPVPFYANSLIALSNQFLAQGVSNPAVSVNKFSFNLIVNPRLTWTTKLAMFRTDGATRSLIMQEEEGLKDQFIGAGSEEEFKNRRWLYGVTAIRNVGYGHWWNAAIVTLT